MLCHFSSKCSNTAAPLESEWGDVDVELEAEVEVDVEVDVMVDSSDSVDVDEEVTTAEAPLWSGDDSNKAAECNKVTWAGTLECNSRLDRKTLVSSSASISNGTVSSSSSTMVATEATATFEVAITLILSEKVSGAAAELSDASDDNALCLDSFESSPFFDLLAEDRLSIISLVIVS